MNEQELAKAIFDWFDRPSTTIDDADPYTYNGDSEDLKISIDGRLDCTALAAAIIAWIPKK